eukprot:CAMPEP_0196994196 /NCGR_PEP_ID=MMETSP1380-20130617/482_1 /TAXON_ID=5936 /ORGANISM="Euplotes crassus, Strain CT5" /LENGTH=290 /DNA_ID=CAMNT_0042409501 /DNA_START=367 /DNA_END=1239 /DNA_ORIENTATION=+
MSSGFTVKGALNISIGSTSCSDEGNSLERSTLPRSRGFRSSSMNLSEGVKQGLPHSLNKNSEGLSKIPELATTFFCESMNQTEINSEISYGSSPSPNSEAASQMGNTKRPAPNKYKTEICRNWQLEGYCRFGDECTFAHGGDELNRKATMPLNYKTKVCKQFTEEPYYCPYGEKCQFIHVNITKKYQATNRTPTYNEMLNETLAQIDNRLKHCNNFEEFELPKSHFRKARLTIFSTITENLNDAKEKDEKEPGSPTPPNKKTSLKLGSKAFHMPIKSPKESSGKDDAIIS